jgi:putative hemin transport protein
VTSVELFDATGFCFAQFFGERKPGKSELEAWRDIVSGISNHAIATYAIEKIA